MFNSSILELENQIHYHQEQQELAEQELDRLKMVSAFAEDATDKVSEALEHIDEKYISVFKEHLLSLFGEQPLSSTTEKQEGDIEYMNDSNPDYKSIEQIQEEEPDTVVAVFHSDEHLKEQKKEKSYYELTGKPDLRPTKYEDLSVNISYSSDGRAYVGFNDREEAESFRERLTVPSLLDKGEIMYMYKWEVKFYCEREYLQQFIEVQKESKSQFEEINPRVLYNHHDKTVYLGMTAKNRCDYYGQYLTGQLIVGKKYTYSSKPSFINAEEYKYELRITQVELEDAIHLASFNLQRDPEHPDNAKLLTDWRANKVRELPPAYTPSPKPTPLNEVKVGDIVAIDALKVKEKQYKVLEIFEGHCEAICCHNTEMSKMINERYHFKEVYKVASEDIQVDDRFRDPTDTVVKTVKKSDELTTEDFVAPPYSKISLDEIEVADIVSTGSHVRAFYEIYQHNGTHVLGRCLYHNSLKMRIGQDGFYITTPYLVEKATESSVAVVAE